MGGLGTSGGPPAVRGPKNAFPVQSVNQSCICSATSRLLCVSGNLKRCRAAGVGSGERAGLRGVSVGIAGGETWLSHVGPSESSLEAPFLPGVSSEPPSVTLAGH